jgi:zinc finger SWIM domain-containing protein 3
MRVKLKRTILYLNLLNVIVFYLIYISFNIVDSIVEIVKDEKNVLQGIYYQKKIMQEMFSNFPELLLIDATYKLNDLRMPLYIMMVVDGNGESEIVALWIVASED